MTKFPLISITKLSLFYNINCFTHLPGVEIAGVRFGEPNVCENADYRGGLECTAKRHGKVCLQRVRPLDPTLKRLYRADIIGYNPACIRAFKTRIST